MVIALILKGTDATWSADTYMCLRERERERERERTLFA